MTNSESLNDCDECLVDHVLLYYSEKCLLQQHYDDSNQLIWPVYLWLQLADDVTDHKTDRHVCETECNGCSYLNLKWTVCVIQCDVVHFTANKPAIECTLYMAFVVLSSLAPFWFPTTRSTWLLLLLITFIIWHSSPLSSRLVALLSHGILEHCFLWCILNMHRTKVHLLDCLVVKLLLVPQETAAVLVQVLCTPYNHATSLHAKPHIYVGCMCV